MSSEEEQKKLKEEFDAKIGRDAFHAGWESLLNIDPAFFSASVSLASVPRSKSHLSPKEQALISLTVDCAATHLYAPASASTSRLQRGKELAGTRFSR